MWKWTRITALGILTLTIVSVGQAQATEFPCRTAKLIVPWGAGGGTGVIFRLVIETVNKTGIKPQLQMVNISGQGGNKGAKVARKAKPDGCTLFAIHQSALSSYLTGRVNFTWDAFEPIAMPAISGSCFGRMPPTSSSNTSLTTALGNE
jgi:tripartite-type tricarboxylate transporter receptor subunit TctC